VTYPELSTAEARAGVQWLLTITNDAWYGPTAAPKQHFLAASFRAAENRLPLLRAALPGVSGVVDAQGRVVDRLEVGEVDTLVVRVGAGTSLRSSGVSPYARAPWLPLLVCLIILLAFGIIPPRHGVQAGPADAADSSEEMD
jgi:apolipoprotein N-acyltransferase